MLGRCLPGR